MLGPAADSGNNRARLRLAKMMSHRDPETSERMLEEAAMGLCRDRTPLAMSLSKRGTDQERAFTLYRQAADNGDHYAMYAVACMYRDGTGTEMDRGMYRYYTHMAAEYGNKDAKAVVRKWDMKAKRKAAKEKNRRWPVSSRGRDNYKPHIPLLNPVPIMTEGWTYAKAGVNIDQKSSAIASLVKELNFKRNGKGTQVRMKNLFASLIEFGDDYLTLATDGVGTKLLIAEELGIWNTVGIDCIAMNVNDTICVGAEPMSFVDYIAIDKPNEEITEQIGIGLQKGAELSNMEIVGGEIAVLPEMVNGVDLSGTCLGYVPKNKVVTGQDCREGDVIVTLRSSGIHSNGLTLARKVFESAGYGMKDKCPGLSGTVGGELLTPTRIYVKDVLDILSKYEVHGLVDITGGGLRNILRMKEGLQYVIDDPLEPAPVFKKIQELGNISDTEIYQTLNMSMGFDIIAPADVAEEIASSYDGAAVVGRVQKGNGVLLEKENILYDRY